jgi:glycosyltransferase involved in cell wall biosynthesis
LVSIITPCYNDSKYTSECVESVLNQDYPYVEHVIQDGKSTDGTTQILSGYANKFPEKIKLVSESDNGQADGLNRAIQHSKGDILLVLNTDDCLLPGACSWAIKHFAENPEIAAVYGDVYIIDENGNTLEKFEAKPYDFEKLLCLELVPPTQGAFIRKTYFEKAGFYADDTLDTCPDYEMWVRIGLKFLIGYAPGTVTKYRRHNRPLDSKSVRSVQRFINSKKLVMDRVFDAPRTPYQLKNLRHRAYGGLYLWAAITEFGLGGKKLNNWRVFVFLTKSLRFYGPISFFKKSKDYWYLIVRKIIYFLF